VAGRLGRGGFRVQGSSFIPLRRSGAAVKEMKNESHNFALFTTEHAKIAEKNTFEIDLCILCVLCG
jgi:hypothetical protein